MKKRYMLKYHHGRAQSLRRFEDDQRADAEKYRDTYWGRKHPPRNGGFQYWQEWHISVMRRHCKRTTNRRIRSQYRDRLHRMDPEDVQALRGADYEKVFDYAWEMD